MKNKFLNTVTAGLILAVSQFFSVAHAGLIIDAQVNSTSSSYGGGNYVAGSEFTLLSDFTIDGLGYIDIGLDGLSEDHRVGLWDSVGNLLVEALVTNSSDVVASNSSLAQWFIQDISPMFLIAGTYRVAGIVGSEATAMMGASVANNVTHTAGYNRTSYPSGGFANPTLSYGTDAVRSTVRYVENVDVPEPSILAIFALGMIGLVSRRSKK